MSDEITTEVAESEQPTALKSNMSPEDFIQSRLGETEEVQVAPEELPESESEPVSEVSEEAIDEVESEESASESSENVLSQLDLDNLSEDQIRELSEKLGSRAVSRFGELTAKRKKAEERLVELENKLSENELKSSSKVENNPYSDLKSIDELKSKAEEVNNIIEWAEDVLFNSDGFSPEDGVAEVDGKSITKKQVRTTLQNARKTRDKFLPDQLKNVHKSENAVKMKESFAEQAESELSWMKGEDNDTRRKYESMIKDPRFVEMEQSVDPEVASQLNYIIAHAANSLYARKTISEKSSPGRLIPPGNATSSAGTPEKTATKSVKALKEISQRFKTSGSKSDFINLRTLQIKNR
tara:strand:- start:1200 stop:2261 length:1062 start_codon:yes stop_codon:yes gene_type:complete